MGAEAILFLWFTSFGLIISPLILLFYQLMCLTDLEVDYINPYDSTSRINKVILPELYMEGCLGLLYLLSGHWLMLLFSAPLIYNNLQQYQKREHLIDVTEIFSLLNREKKRRLIKLIYLLVLLFLSFYWMIWNVLEAT